MLVWVAALRCEAKPIIDYYRLTKSTEQNPFDIYLKENMLCIISGIGKIKAAAATAWIARLNSHNNPIAWINIGTAGSAERPIGTPIWINKISDIESNQQYIPVPIPSSKIESAHCQTLSQASTDYHPKRIYDMEASAFFETARLYSCVELIHCLKIISDNSSQQTGRDKARISALINLNIVQLTSFAQSLIDLRNQNTRLEINKPER